MATTKRAKGRRTSRSKKRRRPKKARPPLWWWLLLAVMPLAGGMAVYIFLRPPPPPSAVKPVGREVVRALAEAALLEGGIPRQRITLSPRELRVSLPEGMDAGDLLPLLRGKLRQAGPHLRLLSRRERAGTRVEVWGGEGKLLSLLFYRPPRQPPQVSVVVDDLGKSLEEAEAFMELGRPLTLSLLPLRPHTRQIAELAHRRGFELMVHIPMEPRGYPLKDPGEGTLLVSMTPEEIRRALETLLKDVPYASGANNHMGSRFMAHPEGVRAVMEALKDRGLFFLDSLTTPSSQGVPVAKRVGVRAVKRDVFLDNDRDGRAFLRQWRLLLLRAKERGVAVGICHPYPSTLQALGEGLRELKGVELVPLSWIVRRARG